jgi:hypothetical protein
MARLLAPCSAIGKLAGEGKEGEEKSMGWGTSPCGGGGRGHHG